MVCQAVHKSWWCKSTMGLATQSSTIGRKFGGYMERKIHNLISEGIVSEN